MTTYNSLVSSLKKLTLGVILFSVSAIAAAANLTMDAGQSKTIKTTKKIDAVFAPAPKVADYEIIDDNTFVIYATGEGRTEVTAFDAEGQVISTNVVNVNGLLNDMSPSANASTQIKKTLSNNSNLSVEKVGKAYVIKGNAKSAADQDNINRVVGEATGGAKRITKTKFKFGDSDDLELPFLDKVEYDGVVNDVNTPSPVQINVKLSVVEVNKEFSDSLGINWANVSGSVVGGFQNVAGRALVTGGGAASVGRGGFFGINARTFSAFVDAINTQTKARILAEPNMSMLSGETADLLVGGEIPFVTRSREETTVVYKDYGVKLLVGAKVMKNNRIRMALAQEVSSISGQYEYEYGSIPTFKTRRSKSVIELNNGESFILGGLLNSEDIEGLSKVPMLGDVPILGSLFRSANTSRNKTELVIVATVTLANPVTEDQINYPKFRKSSTLQRFFHIDPMITPKEREATANFIEQGGFIVQ